jgi:flagellar biosynthesis/type III secretory pathway protein FliH
MSRFALLSIGGAQKLISDSPLIKRSEREEYQSAADLLNAAAKIRDESETAAEVARSEAYADAAQDAAAEFTATLQTQLQNFATDLDSEKEARRTDIADAAFAAVKAILGDIDDTEMMRALVTKTLNNLENQNVLSVQLSPDMARVIGHLDGISIIAEPTFGPYDCCVVTTDSRIVASLSVQLETLARRWGVAADDARGDDSFEDLTFEDENA